MTRVFITGMGVLTPIGNDVPTFWENLLAGKSGVERWQPLVDAGLSHQLIAAVKDFEPEEWVDRKEARRLSRSSQFAVAVSKMALADAGLQITPENWNDIGVMMATGAAGLTEFGDDTMQMERKGLRSVGPFVVPRAMANAVSCNVSIETGARGPVMTSTAACASGHYSIVEAYHYLQRGEASAFIAGGTEAAISLMMATTFGRMGPLTSRNEDPEGASRPFSIDRDGFVPAEGAAAVIVETEEHARARGAHLYAEVLGGRLTADAYHITAPDPAGDGAIRALSGALKNTGLRPADIDVVYAHGTGTVLNDKTEGLALRTVFGSHIDKMKVTSIKCMIGHAMGAAGAESAVAAVMTLQTGIVAPTINYTPDPEIAIPIVANSAQRMDARRAIVDAFGFGGQNVVAILGRVEE
jgi:3-oxoacyl-[acyl-carrier-protein] synthase II